jgi:hypothetical protein
MMFLRPKVLGHRAHNLIRFRARREDWTVKGMTAGREKTLLSRPLGVFTTVLTRASSDVPTRSICLLR